MTLKSRALSAWAWLNVRDFPRWTVIAALIAGALMSCGTADAQTVPGTAQIKWTLPTTTQDGLPLTGANALTSIQVFLATAPIADTSTAQPTVTLGAATTATTQAMQVANGATIYVRLKACNSSGCSPFSNQATKLIQLNTKPNVPTNVTIELTIS